MNPFNEEELRSRLAALPHRAQVLFAAACAERMMEDYAAFVELEEWGDPGLMAAALSQVWIWVRGEDSTAEPLDRLAEACEAQIPDRDRFLSVYAGLAINAGAALVYAIECALQPDPATAAVVGRLAIESIHAFLMAAGNPQLGVGEYDDLLAEWVFSSPLLQRELEQQAADLATLSQDAGLTPDQVKTIRIRSQQLGIRPLTRRLVLPRRQLRDSKTG